MTDYAQHFDSAGVRDLAFSILRHEGREPDGCRWSIRDLCILFDWMHANISYESDESLFGKREFVAGPLRTFELKRGDCEDHALLYGSLCLAVGASVRLALVPEHAFLEVCLGNQSHEQMESIEDEVHRHLKDKSRALGLPGGFVVHQGKLANGWRKTAGGYERTGSRWSYWEYNFKGVGRIIERGRAVYVPVDDCLGMTYIGDIKKLDRYRASDSSKMWADVVYQYPSEDMAEAPPDIPSREDDLTIGSTLTLGRGSHSTAMRITTRLNRRTIREFGEEARFWDSNWQMTMERRDDGWYAVPNPGAPNESIVNGQRIMEATMLSSGDEIAVGRISKGLIKLPLSIHLDCEAPPMDIPSREDDFTTGSTLTLGGGSHSTAMRITTRLNRRAVREFGEEARFWDSSWQMTLERRDDGWYAVPNPKAPNESIVNGRRIMETTMLSSGDEIAVGRTSKGLIKLPLSIRLD